MKQRSRNKTTKDVIRGLAEGLRHQAIRPNIYGYEPHEKQIDFHSSPARKRLFLGGNRSGKTVGGATESVQWLTNRHPYLETPPPPVRGRCVSVDFVNGVEKIVKPEIARWMPAGDLYGDCWEKAFDKETRTLSLKNGSQLEFMSYDQDVDKFAGTSRHFIWFDEEPPRDIYVECLQRLIDTAGSFWITMTPVDGMSSWVYDDLYLQAREDTDIKVVEVKMEDNPHINWGEIGVLLAGLTEEELEARKHGKFIQIGGLIYKMFDPAKHVIDEIPIPPDWLHVAAMDHGFNNPTAWLWAAINKDGKVIIYDEYYKSGEIVRVHAKKVHEINAEHGRVPDYYVGDPSIRNVDPITGTSVLLEYMDFGVPIVLGNNDVKAGLNRVARYLTGVDKKPQLYITKSCPNLIRELGRLRWAIWQSKKVKADRNPKEEQHKKDDHAADACRYLICSRPEMDTGTVVPSINYAAAMGAGVAVKSEGRKDEELLRKPISVNADYSAWDTNMGCEY
jgi:phage terminase large subunit-like protein